MSEEPSQYVENARPIRRAIERGEGFAGEPLRETRQAFARLGHNLAELRRLIRFGDHPQRVLFAGHADD
jgi:hypothetical protein